MRVKHYLRELSFVLITAGMMFTGMCLLSWLLNSGLAYPELAAPIPVKLLAALSLFLACAANLYAAYKFNRER